MDCVMLNSGIQRGLDFSKPETIDLETVSAELTTNYTSYIYLLKYLLPHLQSLAAGGGSKPTSIIMVTSGLALVPMLRCGNYCASKAAVHHLILTTREQLRPQGIKVIEILPPAVQTELHDAKNQPDIKNGGKIGMPLEEFVDETWEGLESGKEAIPVGMSNYSYKAFEETRVEMFNKQTETFAELLKKHM